MPVPITFIFKELNSEQCVGCQHLLFVVTDLEYGNFSPLKVKYSASASSFFAVKTDRQNQKTKKYNLLNQMFCLIIVGKLKVW